MIALFTANVYKSFVRSEIEWLMRENARFRFVTSASNPDSNAYPETITTTDHFSITVRLWHVLQRFIPLMTILIQDLFSRNSSLAYFAKFRSHFSLLLKCSIQADDLFRGEHDWANTKCYSFFANDYSIVLAIATQRGYIDAYDSRAHGRDVIESREPKTGKLPFQWLKYRFARRVYCVSRATQSYIQYKYPAYQSKIKVAYLGSEDRGLGPMQAKNDQFVIVSVGRVRNVKRFYLIPELLMHTNLSIKWIHFGDVQENDPTIPRYKAALNQLQSKPNIEIEQKGFVANDDLLTFYKENYVDVLINTSEIEGLPVSIQEAISFGIPCIATNVGGTSDIVQDATGVLIDSAVDPAATASTLDQFLISKARDQGYRKGVRSFWEAQFNATNNYPQFFKELQDDAD